MQTPSSIEWTRWRTQHLIGHRDPIDTGHHISDLLRASVSSSIFVGPEVPADVVRLDLLAAVRLSVQSDD